MLSAVISTVFSYSAMRLAPQPIHQRYVLSGPLVLGKSPLKFRTPTADRDRTVSRRSKPSSRTTLNGEQPYPWDRLQPQDVMSRHRGAKPHRRYGRLGAISLLSPAYLLSVERWPSTHGTTGSLWPTFVSARPVGLAVRQAFAIALNIRFPTGLSLPSRASVTLWEATAPVKLPTMHGPESRFGTAVRHQELKGWYFKDGSTKASASASKPTTYPTHPIPNASVKLQ